MSLDFVVHVPKYSHRSAGFRALYALADKLQKSGETVTLARFNIDFLSDTNDVSLYEFRDQFTDNPSGNRANDVLGAHQRMIANAVHIVPEIIREAPAMKSVRWILNHKRDTINREQFFEVDWFGEEAPRLCVDVIEKQWFYCKSEKEREHNDGLVLYPGKYGTGVFNKGEHGQFLINPADQLVTYEWPETRQQLGEILRHAEGVISYDNDSCFNLEATICGTPVLIATGQLPQQQLFPLDGMITDPNQFEEATEACRVVADKYEKVRLLIANDVSLFIDQCREQFE